MKKILLILLAFTSFASLAQAEFPEGIALSGNASSTNTSKVVIQEPTTGNLNYINALDLPSSTADKLKGFLSTGLIKNGLISASPDDTKFNITAGIGIISNFDNPENPISTIVNFPAFNFITPTYLNTGNITYVAINSTPAVVMQATPFTPEQRRSLIILGAVIHSNLTTINVLNNISAPTNADTNQLHDFMEAVGALNITGNKYTANGANLQLNKSAGVLFKLGSNFAVDWKNPHEIAQTGGTAITFRYRTQNGTESADMTSISPGLYDLNNVLTTVPNNKFTIQTVTVFQTGLTRIQWGQTLYDDLQSAKNALLTRDFAVENNIKENGVTRAYIIVKNSTTSLQNVSDAYISEAQKFGGVASGGVAFTLSSIVTALGYTPENEANKQNSLAVDGTGVKYPTVDATNAGLATKQNTLTNPITGTGTSNTIPKWTGTTTQGNSDISNVSGVTTINGKTIFNYTGGFGTNIISYKLNGANRLGWDSDGNFYANNFGSTVLNQYSTGGLLFTALSPMGIINGTVASAGIFIGSNSSGLGLNLKTATGNALFKTNTDNGIDAIQTPGTITFSAGTTANQGVIKSQLDLKSNIDSPTFTGVPNVPTATAGTNTTQIASTAFVQANAMALSGDQSFTGTKTFTDNGTVEADIIINNYSTSLDGQFAVRNYSTGNSIRGLNFANGNVIDIDNQSNGTSIRLKDGGNGTSLLIESGLTSATNTPINVIDYTGASLFKVSRLGEVTSSKITMAGTIELKSYTVATLPTGVEGATAYVTDALSPSYLGTLTGGGTVKATVFYDGTVWRSTIDTTDVVKNIVKDATQGANVTGTVSETILYSKLIPANTFKDGDFMTLFSRVVKSGTSGTLSQRVKINTSNTLTGAIQIASNGFTTNQQLSSISRTFTISNNFLTGFAGGNSTTDEIGTLSPPQLFSFNPTIDNYIFITGQLTNSADTMYHLGTKITN